MEPRLILRSMTRKWWIFLSVLLITVAATLFLTMRQTPTYEASVTYIMRLDSEITDPKTISAALDTLNRNDDIQGTFSEIAMSQMIKQQAGNQLGISSRDIRQFSVSSRTLPGSKILEISVQGQDPQMISDFAGAVGEETMTYITNLYPGYKLTLLDTPNIPKKPISPKLPLNLVLGTILGAFLGLAALLLSSWLRGDFKNLSATHSDREEPEEPGEPIALLPVRTELELLLQQCELIRSELDETRKMIHSTESQAKRIRIILNSSQARRIRTILNSYPKNGNSHEKVVVPMEEDDETGYLEGKSPNE